MKTFIMIFILMTASLISQAQCHYWKKMDNNFHFKIPEIPTTIITRGSAMINVFADKPIILEKIYSSRNDEIHFTTNENFLHRFNTNYLRNRNFWIRGGLIILGGSAEAHIDALRSFYPEFKRVYPKANDSFWDPKYASNNKYKNGDPEQGEKFLGSTTIFSGFTDGYHLVKTVRNLCFVGSLVIPINPKNGGGYHYFVKKKFSDYLIEIVTSCIFYEIGMEGTLKIIHNK